MNNNIKIEKLFNIGLLEKNNGNISKAKKIFKKIVSITNSLEAKSHLLEIFLLEKQFSLAKIYLEELIEKKLNLANNYNTYGAILTQEKKYSEAISFHKKALEIQPDKLIYKKNLASNYRLNRQYKESLDIYLQINQDFPYDVTNLITISNLFFLLLNPFFGFKYLLKAYKINPKNYDLLCSINRHLPYIKIKQKNYFKYLKRSNYILNTMNDYWLPQEQKIKPNNKTLKLGFLSSCFFQHPISFFLIDFLKEIKNFDIKIVLFSDRIDEDTYSKKLRNNCFNFLHVKHLDTKQLIEKINSFNLNFLFDLDGITNHKRNSIFNSKITKNVSWCGWLTSTGLDSIDYIYGDKYATPSIDQFKFNEKLINENSIWACLSTSDIKDVNHEINLDNKYFIYGIFQNPLKFSKNSISAWAKILNQTTNTKILFSWNTFQDLNIRKKLLKLFSFYHISEERINFAPNMGRKETLECYNTIDGVLDTFPYNGGTSSFEASYMGVPIITMDNPMHIMFRCGTSINSNLGLIDLIAKDENDYVTKAITLANKKDLKFRKNLLIDNRKTKLFDIKEFCENFSKTFSKLS